MMMPDKKIPDILKKIIADKKDEVSLLKGRLHEYKSAIKDTPLPLDFEKVLRKNGLSVIAEIKKASPSAGIITKKFDPVKIALAYRESGADAISVLTDSTYFHGHIDFIRQIRELVPDIPILRKDFIINEVQIYEARAAGADTFLLIAAVLSTEQLKNFIYIGRSIGMEPLTEIHNKEELEKAVTAGAKIIGINNRNLHNFKVDIKTSEKLFPHIPKKAVKVSESGIHTGNDTKQLIKIGFNAILVGESLMRTGIKNCGKLINGLKKGITIFIFLTICSTIFLFYGCASKRRPWANLQGKIYFPKLKDYKITLAIISPRRLFYAGDKNASLLFQLRNIGEKKIVVYEWIMDETKNVKIYYRPYKEGVTKQTPGWKCINPKYADNVRRATLVLNPKNGVLILKKLPFITNINPRTLPPGGIKYAIYGALTLDSIQAETGINIINVK